MHGAGPEEHFHDSLEAVGGSAELSIIRASAIVGIRHNRIAADASPAIIVDLEIPAVFVKAVLVEEVVGDVVPIEKVRDRGRLIGRGRKASIEGEIENEPGPPVRAKAAGIVGIGVLLGVHVVAPGIGEFRSGDSIRIVPAVGRRDGRVDEGRGRGDDMRSFVGSQDRCRPENPVGFVRDPIDLSEDFSCFRVDLNVPPVPAIRGADHEIPREVKFVVHGLVDQFGRNRIA